jgi:hypothetical protein
LATGIPTRLTRAEGRRFGLTVGAAFLLLSGLFWWRGHGQTAVVLSAIGGSLVLGGLAIPGRLGPVYHVWMKLALLLSKVTTPVFMGVVYFIVITPVGLVIRALRRNPLVRSSRQGSYWILRPPGASRRGDIERQF